MASQLDTGERPDEVPSFLPPYEGKHVLKLGDFENMNKSDEYMSVDVNSPDLNFSAESIDLIFSNWLSIRLSNQEINDIAKKLLNWTKVGGYILFREPCSHQAGVDKQMSNIQDVRGPRFFTEVFKKCHLSDAFGNSFEFSLVGSKCIDAYEINQNNHNQIWWIWKKVNSKDDMGSQPILDNVQYKNSVILHYERIFGLGFVCMGGIDTTKEFVAMLDLKAGQKVLDVGCGIGGSAFYMVDNFDVDVVGIDLSVNMICFALERAIGHKRSIEFEVADCTKKSYPDNTFDVIYSRDTILHIQDKPALFRTFYKWLKPGGKVFISDFCRGGKTSSPDVEKLIKQQGYDLHDAEHYCQMLKDAGFQEVTKEDRTKQSKDEFLRHMQKLEMEKKEFLRDFSEIKVIAKKLLKWTKSGGYILFREPCSHQDGADKQKSNKQDVRGPSFLTKVFKKCHLPDAFGNSFEFSLVGSKCIETYELNKKNHNQIWWIWKKVNSKDDMGCQSFLDDVMYKSSAILRFERIFGDSVSIGGIDTTKEFVAMLDLKAGQKVLDVGCGTGGSAFYMVDNFDVDVVGIDLSVNMISFALERAIGHKRSVEFEVANCTKKSYPNNTFDVIYSRDVILHIQDKPSLFQTFYKWLKPGGKVLITDFCFCGKARIPSPDVAKFVKQLGYDFHDVDDYYQMFKDAGFQEVTKEDRTKQSKNELQRHLERLEKDKEEFIGDFSEEEYNDFVGGWKENFTRIGTGEQRYCMIFAKKK